MKMWILDVVPAASIIRRNKIINHYQNLQRLKK